MKVIKKEKDIVTMLDVEAGEVFIFTNGSNIGYSNYYLMTDEEAFISLENGILYRNFPSDFYEKEVEIIKGEFIEK